MMRYKSNIIPTISLFFKAKNNIDIFIEDSNDEEFYKVLVNRLVGEGRVNKVISCKCKSELIKACESDQTDRKRKRIYITDGDLDLILGSNKKNLKHLYVLGRYCIENFLVEEDGIIEVLHSIIVLNKDKIKRQLTLDNFFKSISNSLIELFLHYSITHYFSMGIKTVSNPVASFCKQHRAITVLDIDKIENKIKEIREKIILRQSEEIYNEMIYNLRLKWPSNIQTFLTVVSAKDYVIPLLVFRFKKLKGKETFSLKREALRLSLAKNVKLHSLDSLKQEINKV